VMITVEEPPAFTITTLEKEGTCLI